jgi:hypothetical protein
MGIFQNLISGETVTKGSGFGCYIWGRLDSGNLILFSLSTIIRRLLLVAPKIDH